MTTSTRCSCSCKQQPRFKTTHVGSLPPLACTQDAAVPALSAPAEQQAANQVVNVIPGQLIGYCTGTKARGCTKTGTARAALLVGRTSHAAHKPRTKVAKGRTKVAGGHTATAKSPMHASTKASYHTNSTSHVLLYINFD